LVSDIIFQESKSLEYQYPPAFDANK